MNPKYTGRQVWNRQRRDEVLLDVDDVAAGYQSRMRWNDASQWIWSTDQMHDPIVSSEDFSRAQSQMAVGAHRPFTAKGHRTEEDIPPQRPRNLWTVRASDGGFL